MEIICMKNLLKGFKRSNFEYWNMADEDDFALVETSEDGISLIPNAHTGMYCDPEGKKNFNNAAYMYVNVKGDFSARVRMDLDFVYAEDAAAVMIYDDAENWATVNFEKSIFRTKAVTTCVTKNGSSDKSEGPDYPWPSLWLHVVRKGENVAFFYSPDGVNKHLLRLFKFSASESIRVGLTALSPNGNGDSTMNFYSFELAESFTVKDLGEGN